MNQMLWAAVLIFLLLCSVAAVFLLGTVGLTIPTLMLALLMVRVAAGSRGESRWEWTAQALAALGGIVGVVSALGALIEVGGTAPYGSRVPFGILALLCAVVAGAVPILASTHRVAAIIALAVCGLVGGIAINLFYINTFYIVAVLLWWLAALVLSLAPSRPATHTTEAPSA